MSGIILQNNCLIITAPVSISKKRLLLAKMAHITIPRHTNTINPAATPAMLSLWECRSCAASSFMYYAYIRTIMRLRISF